MRFVFTEILPWMVAALVVGFVLGLLFWRYRLWLDRDAVPRADLLAAREEAVTQAGLAEKASTDLAASVARAEKLASANETLESGRAAAEESLEIANRQLVETQTRLEEADARTAELDRTNTELADARTRLTDANARIAELEARHEKTESELQTARAEMKRTRARVAEIETAASALPVVSERPSSQPATIITHATAPAVVEHADAGEEVDLSAAKSVLGYTLTLDNFKVIEGIGPKIEQLLKAAGIHTWRMLSKTDPAVLERILEDAGPRFRLHDPGTWPEQAGLLADGRWDEFASLTSGLKGGRRS